MRSATPRRGAGGGIARCSRDALPLYARQEKSPARPTHSVLAGSDRRQYSLRGNSLQTRAEAAQSPPWRRRRDDNPGANKASLRAGRRQPGARPQRVIRMAGSPPVQTGILLRKNRMQKNGRIIQAAGADERRNAWDAL